MPVKRPCVSQSWSDFRFPVVSQCCPQLQCCDLEHRLQGGGCSAAVLVSAGTGSDAAVTPAPPCCRLWNTAVADPKPKSSSSLCPLLGVCQGRPEPPGSPASKMITLLSLLKVSKKIKPSLLRTQPSRKDLSCFESTSSKLRNSISFKGTLTCKRKYF